MANPLLHLVFGGEVDDPASLDYRDCEKLDIVGIFPNYATALEAWQGASRAQIDNAQFNGACPFWPMPNEWQCFGIALHTAPSRTSFTIARIKRNG